MSVIVLPAALTSCAPASILVALSDLTHEDLLIYHRFLADPQPTKR